MKKKYKVNDQIKDKFVNVVLVSGELLKNVEIDKALNIAKEEKLDLVEVSPSKEDKVAICKILDYGKLRYKESKKKKSKPIITKEIKISLNIADHDLDTKNRQVEKFLGKGNNVKYTLKLKGREKYSVNEALQKFCQYLKYFDDKTSYNKPKVNGRNISTVLKPC